MDTRSPTDDYFDGYFGYYNRPHDFGDSPSFSPHAAKRSDDAQYSRTYQRAPVSRLPPLRSNETSHNRPVPPHRASRHHGEVQSSSVSQPSSFILRPLASRPKPEADVCKPLEDASRPQKPTVRGMTADQEGSLDQTKFPELSRPWRWAYIPSTTTNPAGKLIAPIHQETQEVHESPNSRPLSPFRYCPIPAIKDTVGSRRRPTCVDTSVKSDTQKPTDLAAKDKKGPPSEGNRDSAMKIQPNSEGTPVHLSSLEQDSRVPKRLSIRMSNVCIHRERVYSNEEIDEIVAEVDKTGHSLPDLLQMLRAGPSTVMASASQQLRNIAATQAKDAQRGAGAHQATEATLVRPTDIPTQTTTDCPVTRMKPLQTTVITHAATGVAPARCTTENNDSSQTVATPKQKKWWVIDEPKVSEEKNPQKQFETLDLDSNEEGWEKIDDDEDWEVVDDPRLVVERKAV